MKTNNKEKQVLTGLLMLAVAGQIRLLKCYADKIPADKLDAVNRTILDERILNLEVMRVQIIEYAGELPQPFFLGRIKDCLESTESILDQLCEEQLSTAFFQDVREALEIISLQLRIIIKSIDWEKQ